MNEKILTVKNHIQKGMPDRNIEYQNAGGLYKFKIKSDGPTHWLYLSEEVVDDSDAVVLINFINIYHIVENLAQADSSKWLFMETQGIREVDENFAK